MTQIFNSTKFINPLKNKQLKNTVNSKGIFQFQGITPIHLKIPVLDTFAKLRKATTSFLTPSCLSVCCRPSVRPHGTTRLPLDGLLLHLKFDFFFKYLCRKFKFQYNLTRKEGTLH